MTTISVNGGRFGATQLALRVDQTPEQRHATARRRVTAAIATVAELNGGRVSPNAVRSALAMWPDIPPQVVGATYRALRLAGHLAYDATEISDDVRGGNAGKIHRTYRWVTR